jgi:hypothetical protein
MEPDDEDFKKKLAALKPKKKIDVAADVLQGANDNEGKILAIQIIADRELKRTVMLFKNMIAQGQLDKVRIQSEQDRKKREDEEKAAAEKKRKAEAEKKSKKSLFGRK